MWTLRLWTRAGLRLELLGLLAGFLAASVAASEPKGGKSAGWTSPLQWQGKLQSPLVEVTPFVFHDKLYRLENWQKQWEHPGAPDGSHFQQDEIRIRDMASETIVSVPLKGHGLGVAFVWQNRVHVFAGDWGRGEKKWGIEEIRWTSSDDLKTWSEPQTVVRAIGKERLFNVSVCRGPDRFIMLVETNDRRWPAFTFRFLESNDLKTWKPIENAYYGTNKYVGGPALYFEGGWYYTLYLESLGKGRYETRITRSRDLKSWQDAPAGRPFATFDDRRRVFHLRPEKIREVNASDVEVVFWKGQTLVYYTGGDQQLCGDLQWATFDGTPRALFERFFAP